MNNEYIIVNKTVLEKIIEELIKERKSFVFNASKTSESISHNEKIKLLEQIISKSTPLVPEILKSIEFGALMDKGMSKINKQVEDYIANLKLDI